MYGGALTTARIGARVRVQGRRECHELPEAFTKVEEIDDIAILTAERAGGPLCTADMLLVPTYFELEKGRPDEVVIQVGSEQYRHDVIDGD